MDDEDGGSSPCCGRCVSARLLAGVALGRGPQQDGPHPVGPHVTFMLSVPGGPRRDREPFPQLLGEFGGSR